MRGTSVSAVRRGLQDYDTPVTRRADQDCPVVGTLGQTTVDSTGQRRQSQKQGRS